MGHTPRNSGNIPERPWKRSQFFSCNSPREYGQDPPTPIIQGSRAFPEFDPPQYTAADVSFFCEWFRKGPLIAGHPIPSSTGGISETCRACPTFAVRTAFGRFSSPNGQKFRERPPRLIQHVLTVLGRILFFEKFTFLKNRTWKPRVGSSDSGKRRLAVGENRWRVKRTVGEPWGLHREPWENRGGCTENRWRTVGIWGLKKMIWSWRKTKPWENPGH